MYSITCDEHPLLDVRDDDYILGSPRVKTEVNTVGECSFRIYHNHPNINKLVPLRSMFEVKDEYGVLFRGRMTEDTKDFDNHKDVDIEGVMSYFNDSVVRSYVFPDDFEDDDEYQDAASETPEEATIDGGVVRFLLKWYIDRHNEQVEPFQRFKLGRVTVYDKNNYIERSASDYPSTWKELSEKLFNSSLGGYLCIRYEEDGNYIDYLREFTEVNEQGITYGDNLLDISQNSNASETYSAIIPLGASSTTTTSNGDVYEGMYGDIVGGSSSERRLTIETLPNGNITDDIVKKGDTLYSKSAVAAYGWRYAPRDETTWDDVEEPANLQTKGVEFLEGDSTKIPNTIKVTAVDLNCTDTQIRSFRIYKKIPVYTKPHNVNDNFDLTALDIDLLNPQNTKITVGKIVMTLTKYQTKEQSKVIALKTALNKYAEKAQVEEGFKKTEVRIEEMEDEIVANISGSFVTQDELEETVSSFRMTDDEIIMAVSGTYATFDDLGNYVTYDEHEASLALSIEDGIAQLSGHADKIVFGANEIEIHSDNFTLDEDGNVSVTGDITATSLTLTEGASISGDITAKTVYSTYEFTDGRYWIGILDYTGLSTSLQFEDYTYRTQVQDGVMIQCKSGTILAEGNLFADESGYFHIEADHGTGSLDGTWVSESSISVLSDKTLKHDIEILNDKYSVLFDCLQAVRYKYNDGTSDRFHTGFIAQSVEEAIEQAGLTSQEFAAFMRINDTCTLRYEEFIALCVNEIQKLKMKITELERRVQET